jgi:tRNA(Arg) A34 adenosine deaminase TadA
MLPLLRLAAYYALKGDPDRNFYLGCVIQRKDGAIIHSWNKKTEIPNPSTHAEARALQKADYKSTLYVARVTRDGGWAIAKPCTRCQARIRNKGIERVIYTIGPAEYGVWYPQRDKSP